jgi:hypothetical protein
MALDDINLSANEQSGFILEVPSDVVSAPVDILFADDCGIILEVPTIGGESFGGGFF